MIEFIYTFTKHTHHQLTTKFYAFINNCFTHESCQLFLATNNIGIKINNGANGRDDNRSTRHTVVSANSGGTGNNGIKKLPERLKYITSPSLVSHLASSSPNILSESKQTIQVLEPCSPDELCLSMSQCHSLNPQFMAKTGLNPASSVAKHIYVISNSNKQLNTNDSSEPVKVKRCKYERSGIHYLCCKKPEEIPTTSSSTSTSSPPPTEMTFQFTPDKFTPTTTFTFPFSLPTPTTTKSSLITGFGLRFHSGLHTAKQKEINSKKPNPYGENEEPIQLISPPEKTTVFTSTTPFVFHGTTSTTTTAQQPFRFTTTTTTPAPVMPSKSTEFHQDSRLFSPRPSHESISAFARVIGTSRTYFSATTPPPRTTTAFTEQATTHIMTPEVSSTTTTTGQQTPVPVTNSSSTITPTTPATPTTTEGKVDISKIPIPVPIRPELKAEPPIGFIFKGESLFIPEVEIPSQNYLVPINDFEERTFPTEPPTPEEEEDQLDETAALSLTEILGVVTTTTPEDSGGGGGGEVQDDHDQAKIIINRSNTKSSSVFSNRNPFLHNNSIEGTTIYSILDESSGSQERAVG